MPTGMDDLAGRPLTLDEAIALAFERQSRLRVYLESVQQARGLSDIAFAPFLPTLATGYSVGAYNLNVGGSHFISVRCPVSRWCRPDSHCPWVSTFQPVMNWPR